MKTYSLIYLCGGVGKRATQSTPKQFKLINGIPMLIYSMIAINEIDEIDEVIVNYPDGHLDMIKSALANYAISKRFVFVRAGKTRQESVHLMLAECRNDHVIVHEAARPLAHERDFRELIAASGDNVSYVCEVPFSVATVDPEQHRIVGKLERARIRNIQLPQKFSRALLSEALDLAAREGAAYTEETAACLAIEGADIRFIDGKTTNIKITYSEDFIFAELLIRGVERDE